MDCAKICAFLTKMCACRQGQCLTVYCLSMATNCNQCVMCSLVAYSFAFCLQFTDKVVSLLPKKYSQLGWVIKLALYPQNESNCWDSGTLPPLILIVLSSVSCHKYMFLSHLDSYLLQFLTSLHFLMQYQFRNLAQVSLHPSSLNNCANEISYVCLNQKWWPSKFHWEFCEGSVSPYSICGLPYTCGRCSCK